MHLIIIALQLVLLLILGVYILYFASMLISDLFGIPYVPTRSRSLREIFTKLSFNKKDVFYDLGSGDGRLPFYIAKKYNIKAVGVELNPLLYFYSQLKKKICKTEKVYFYRKNFFDQNLSDATVIYSFLFPEVVEKLSQKIRRECQKKTIIISHGFKIKSFASKLVFILPGKRFRTYFYQL